MTTEPPTTQLDGALLAACLSAGIRHVFGRREYIDRINVFPVPDGDTGTNMAFTFKSIHDALESLDGPDLSTVLAAVAEAALDGARGNSGAIMAQYFQGLRESLGEAPTSDTGRFAQACLAGARQSWSAMSEPVAGTLPTVLEDVGQEAVAASESGVEDFRTLFEQIRVRAQASLANTPELLPVLKQAGVVDAGGQGFVDLLDGIHAWLETGELEPVPDHFEGAADDAGDFSALEAGELGDHRYCTECVIEGQGLDRVAVKDALSALDHSSLVVAGSDTRVRVHIHVNEPGEVFLACEEFGAIHQQKADDMQWQHGLMNLAGKVAVVTDSGADLPASEAERLGLQVVPVRLSFGDQEYLDGVSLTPAEFYELLATSEVFPKTSQPPAKDFRRVYDLLGAHGYEVLVVGLSSHLSGTLQAARSAAERTDGGQVRVFDSLHASCGQGLLALVAAEAAAEGWDRDRIEQLMEDLRPRTHTLAMVDELTSAVRGGRVPGWVARVANTLRLTPILAAKEGHMSVGGAAAGRGVNPAALAKRVLKRMRGQGMCRVLIAHADNEPGARDLRRHILAGHPEVHSCHLADAGPALGVHLGRGGLVVGFLPDPHVLVSSELRD